MHLRVEAARRCLIDLVCLLLPITPEDRARENIDKLLTDAGLDRPGQARYQSVRPAEPLKVEPVYPSDKRKQRRARKVPHGHGASTSCKIPAHMKARLYNS
jgi:hypothetical protein